MSAIITEKFRKNNVDLFLDDLITQACYVGVGRSQDWPIIDGDEESDNAYVIESPLGTYADMEDVKNNLITLIGIGNTGATSRVIPKVDAKTTRRYKAFNPYSIDCFYQSVIEATLFFPCYVVIGTNVYLCLKASSIVGAGEIPTGSETTRDPFVRGGAVWIFVYSYVETPSLPINATQFMSVPSVASPVEAVPGVTISTATGNLVYGFTVINGGTGFVSLPTVVYVTDSGAEVTLDSTISGGAITSVTYAAPEAAPGDWIKENGYVKITGVGTDARVYPNIAPATGIGFNPTEDLPSWYAGVKVQLQEDLNDAVFVPYRQISIIRDPSIEGGTLDGATSLSGLDRLEFDVTDAPTSAVTGELITQVSSGAIAITDFYDPTNRYLYYHQNHDTGFVPFIAGTPLDGVNDITVGVQTAVPTVITPSEYVTGTGDVLFVENRRKITRTGGQTEDLTIILQF